LYQGTTSKACPERSAAGAESNGCRKAKQKYNCHPERSAATNFSSEKCVFPARSRMDLRLLLLNREGRSLSTGSKLKMEAKPIPSRPAFVSGHDFKNLP
jgi:hypothetical protein